MEHRTGAVLCKTFQEVWGTFRGQKVHFCEFFGKKLPFWQFSKGRHGLQFWPFDNPISRATLMELELLCAGGFGGSLTHLGVKKSVLVHFFDNFLDFSLPPVVCICPHMHHCDIFRVSFLSSEAFDLVLILIFHLILFRNSRFGSFQRPR